MSLKHVVTWRVSIEELKEIVKNLEECPCISLPIDDTTELIIIEKELPTFTFTSSTDSSPYHQFSITT